MTSASLVDETSERDMAAPPRGSHVIKLSHTRFSTAWGLLGPERLLKLIGRAGLGSTG
jgi:hypothetical protein